MESMISAYINQQMKESVLVKEKTLSSSEVKSNLLSVGKLLINCYQNGNRTLLAGNGGSAADAQHIAAELVSRFYFDRPGLPSIALTTDSSMLTAIGNDYGYDKLFARQVQANGTAGDVFIGISTSGNSINVVNALKVAKEMGLVTVGLTGETGGEMKALCDYCICVPSRETPRIQEVHILIGHILCAIVEESMFGKGFQA